MVHDILLQASELREYRRSFIISPIQWAGYAPVVELTWNLVKFGPTHVTDVPDTSSGVYTFVVQPGIVDHPHCSYLLYVGRTTNQNFKERYQDYLVEKTNPKIRRPHITEMLNKWDGYLWFCYAEIENHDNTIQTEELLQSAYVPPFNKRFPADIRAALGVLR